MENIDKNSLHSFLFYQLLNTFQNAAWQQLGKQLNPLTNMIEKDFAQASLSISMLDMLFEKTQGNLSVEEKRFLEQIISDLKLNYVEEVSKEPTEQKEAGESDQEKESNTTETKDVKEMKDFGKEQNAKTDDNP